MGSSDESEEELHDIDWGNQDPFFEYEDPFVYPPQMSAVNDNDIRRLQKLLNSGQSVNINDNNGNTPLHVAILKDKMKAFNYLLTVDDVRIDAENFDGVTPLVMALICSSEKYALKLIKKGADVNLARNTGYSPLHYAATNSIKVAQLLIDMGAEINARTCLGETPLYLACDRGQSDSVYMLLYYGADVHIPCYEGILPFTIALSKCPVEVQEILFDYTFDKGKVPVNLYTLMVAMSTSSPLFYKVVEKTSDVEYDVSSLAYLNDSLPYINQEMFKVFMRRFEDVARDLFSVCKSLMNYITFLGTFINESPDFVSFFYTLCESPFIGEIVDNYNPKVFLVHSIINRNISEDTLTKLICCLLSYGVDIISDDVNSVYKSYGFCTLFKIMLHMDIIDCHKHNEDGHFETFLLPILIYDINLDIDKCLMKPEKYIFPFNLPRLLKFFANPKLRDYCLKSFQEDKVIERVMKQPLVPSLVELSRDVARQYIIKRYRIKRCAQFFTILNWLPISKVYKNILSYEKEIYNV